MRLSWIALWAVAWPSSECLGTVSARSFNVSPFQAARRGRLVVGGLLGRCLAVRVDEALEVGIRHIAAAADPDDRQLASVDEAIDRGARAGEPRPNFGKSE